MFKQVLDCLVVQNVSSIRRPSDGRRGPDFVCGSFIYTPMSMESLT